MIARFPRLLLSAAVATALLTGAAACGKKGAPKPPSDEESQYTYPQAYPAPSTVMPDGANAPEDEADPLSIFRSENRSKTTSY
jgi:hypothetical protein